MDSSFQSESRLTGKDVRALALWLLAGVIGAAFAFQYFFAAFPEASVDFRVTRGQAVEKARSTLAELGHDVAAYQSSVVFQVDQDAKTYLEREVGLEQANRLMATELTAWWWDVRFFRPQQQEEFRVKVDPAGRVVGLAHTLEEKRAGAHLESDTARPLAEALLRERLKLDLTAYEYLPGEANPTDRPNRRDWSFTWERRIPALVQAGKDAPYRLRVTVQGDRPGGYEEFLRVPEAWKRDFELLRSSNTFFQLLAQVPYAFLLGGVFLVLYDLARRGRVNWRGALQLGLTLAALFFVMNANEWPLTRHGYDTNSSYPGFLVLSLALAAAGSLGIALLVTLSVAAGEPLYRADHPHNLRLGAAFSRATWRDGLRSKEFFTACVIGLAMAAAHIGFVVAFYLLGQDIGFWAPQEIKYTDAVSTAVPWIYPLAISLFAATSEEFVFRLFAIPLLLRLTKSKWIALLVPAIVWGFLHSAYPQQPGWVRGVEVSIIGVVAGWVMLRWGILATLVWHYTVDALLIGLFLLRSESLYFQLSGGAVTALTLFPLAFALAAYLTHGHFAANEEIFNGATREESPPVASETVIVSPPAADASTDIPLATPRVRIEAVTIPSAAAAVTDRTLSQPLRLLLAATAVAGIALALWMRPERVGDHVRFTIHRQQAEALADKALTAFGAKPDEFHRASVVVDTFNGVTLEYLRQHLGMPETRGFYAGERVPSVFWSVRYFKDSEKEEYRVILRPDGTLHAIHHDLREAAPGASLTKEEAQLKAETHFLQLRMFDLSRWKLVEAETSKRPNRADHLFTWEEIAPIAVQSPPNYDAVNQSPPAETAHVRMQLRVQGEEVSGYRIFVKIPEQWERDHTQRTFGWISYQVARGVLFLAWGVALIVFFFKNLKSAPVPWRRLSRWALWAALMLLVNAANSIPELMANYLTDFPLRTFIAVIVLSQLFVAGVFYSAIFLLLGFGWFLLARIFGAERLPAWRGMPAWYYRDALLLGLGGAGGLAIVARAISQLDRLWPTSRAATESATFESLSALLPTGSIIAAAVIAGFFAVGLVAVVAGSLALLRRFVPPGAARAVQFGSLLLLAVALIGSWGSPADFAKQVLLQFLLLAVYAFGVSRVFRFNMLGYFLLAALGSLALGAADLLQHPETFLRWNGYATAAAALLLLAWPLAGWLRLTRAAPSADGTV
jgi:membrane protease YdiL (CAAX protease family)